LPAEVQAEAHRRWAALRAESVQTYDWLNANEVARELARIDLPLSTYTQWYWKIDLHNLLHFLTLRVDAHAQWEIQAYGRVMAGMLKRVAPLSYEAWIDYDVCGGRLSRMELLALRELLRPTPEGGLVAEGRSLSRADLEAKGLSGREADEFLALLARTGVPDFTLDLAQARSAEYYAEQLAAAVRGQ
jgi:thymidylate synthase (FAD)